MQAYRINIYMYIYEHIIIDQNAFARSQEMLAWIGTGRFDAFRTTRTVSIYVGDNTEREKLRTPLCDDVACLYRFVIYVVEVLRVSSHKITSVVRKNILNTRLQRE